VARKCPNCGTDTVMFSAVPLTREDQVGAACPKCDWRESMADLRRQLAEAKERYADIERRFEGDTLLDCLREAAEAAKGDNDV